ncbi:DNA repair and recombination protein RAD54B-like [Mizuhopecten yessoensis]|nr:DNA repair and recombination protein RAD54B-like [Mizuhopecten yessoensis]XP_021350673.1 DNA repair and recombination protein RAD54B-like [Mizuhopecten yessoensis]XP_021350674.1 DNA repair and recombination protein RAD54B-like [Mizuhopecten yessoensis]
MRRSGAPSQGGVAKRPRFSAPFKTPVLKSNNQQVVPSSQSKPVITTDPQPEVDVKSSTARAEVTQLTKPAVPDQPHQDVSKASRPHFRVPLQVRPSSGENQETNKNVTQEEATEGQTRYLNVMWCKRSNKKHKKWEGDAILITKGRSVTLLDMEGKEIGKSSGYKCTELETLKDDETLAVGGKEIQVMSVMTEQQFKSGKCFSASSLSQTPSCPSVCRPSMSDQAGVNKAFVSPQTQGNSTQAAAKAETPTTQLQPRHSVDQSGALVMPRPSKQHQWSTNKNSLPIVDVVVDPHIASHLRPHQREGVVFLYECIMGFRDFSGQGAILADDMGLGKTLQSISLLWTLLKQGPYGGRPVIKKALIITPGSLVKNWQQEIKKWLGSERLSVYAVSTDQRVEDFVNTAIYPVLIISYEMFVRAYDMIQKLRFDLIICDEGHRLKNTAIKTTSLIMSMPTRRRVVLSGTPIQNDLQEFFSIVEFCNPGILGSSAAFKNVYENPIVASRQPGASQQVLDIGEERASELSRLIKLFLLRRTQEINNKYLPPKSEVVVFCSPSDLQVQLYRVLLSCRLIRSCLSGQLQGAPHLICIGALKQLCNHPLLLHSRAKDAHQSGLDEESVYEGLLPLYPEGFLEEEHLEKFSGKLSVLAGILADLHEKCPTEKVVLVSNHTKTLDMLQKFCDQKQYGFLRLDGQTPTNRRQEIVKKFNNKFSKEFVFLLSSKAGGVGLNLIGASRLILYDIDWNPANDLQAMARVWRDGQAKQVHIYRLLTTGTIEEKIYQRQITKQGLSGAVMEAKAGKSDVHFSKEDLKDLFSLNVNTLCDTHELLSCDCEGGLDNVAGSSSSSDITPSSVRPCQLGAGGNHKAAKRNLGMDELMDWKHLRGNSGKTDPDWFLDGVAEDVSFIFWHETKS